ncbi:hypothetical protein RND81_09G212000 [Saponaria officinalis]|uniref:RING-type domain-containing protein n=1 Tax=Saponaria officinalis TaxID=3572 RepID=A0AAW1IQF5_SAPOF
MENGDEQAKQQQGQKQLSFDMLEQVDADHALALALQQQESAFTMLETINSDVDDGDGVDEEVGSSSSNDFDSNLESQDFYELEFLGEDEEGSDTDDEVEEDEIDPDDMSYEELIALGEIVGEESRGLSIDEIASSLSSYEHKIAECKTTIDRCVVCQIDYEKGEHLVALHCEHPFHFECINQWLQIKKVCPICSIEVIPRNNSKKM